MGLLLLWGSTLVHAVLWPMGQLVHVGLLVLWAVGACGTVGAVGQ